MKHKRKKKGVSAGGGLPSSGAYIPVPYTYVPLRKDYSGAELVVALFEQDLPHDLKVALAQAILGRDV